MNHSRQRFAVWLVALGIMVPLCGAAHAVAAEHESPRSDPSDAVVGCGLPECNHCGAFLVGCGALVLAEIVVDGQQDQYVYSSPSCLHDSLLAWDEEAELLRFRVLDYSSFGQAAEKLIDGLSAYYLVRVTAKLPVDNPLAVVAFSSEESAKLAQTTIGGELIEGWDALSAVMAAGDDKNESLSVEPAGDATASSK